MSGLPNTDHGESMNETVNVAVKSPGLEVKVDLSSDSGSMILTMTLSKILHLSFLIYKMDR